MYDGVPWEVKHRQRTKEQRMRRDAGLLPQAPGVAATPGVPAAGAANNGSDAENEAVPPPGS